MNNSLPYLTFRIDDISLNTNLDRLYSDFIEPIELCFKESRASPYFVFGVSPAVFDMPLDQGPKVSERIFPSILNAYSDQEVFYRPHKTGLPDLRKISEMIGENSTHAFCAHGMFHIDHRLISKEAQEINILSSLSMVEYECTRNNLPLIRAFIPPFNKTNDATDEISKKHSIRIIKWSPHAWRHLAYLNENIAAIYSSTYQDVPDSGIYLHTHDFSNREEVEEKLKYIQHG